MNISTYEARIAALEAQIGPGPGPSTGSVLSVVVTPDITLNNETTLNEKLATLMPVTEFKQMEEYGTPSLTVGDVYTYRVTPSENYYVYTVEDEPVAATGDAGEAVDIQVEVAEGHRDKYIAITALAGPTVEPDENTWVGITLRVTAPKQ